MMDQLELNVLFREGANLRELDKEKRVEQLFAEHVLKQAAPLQLLESILQRERQAPDRLFAELIRRHGSWIGVHRSRGRQLAPDTVEPGGHHRRQRQVGVAAAVHALDLEI